MATEPLAPPQSELNLKQIGKEINKIIRGATPRRSGIIVGHRGPNLTGLTGDEAFRAHPRSELYQKAKQIAPDARAEELRELRRRMQIRRGHRVLELGAGDGFVTIPMAEDVTGDAGVVFAVDSSPDQLAALEQQAADLSISLPIRTIEGSFGDPQTLERLGEYVGHIDIATTLATFHHLVGVDEQTKVFRNIGKALREGGEFHGGDPGQNTDVQLFFDLFVEPNCITGHDKLWLSPKRIKDELIPQSGLVFESAEVTKNQKMRFATEDHMLWFIKSMLALNMTKSKLREALGDILKFKKGADGQIELGWDLLYWKVIKPDPTAAT